MAESLGTYRRDPVSMALDPAARTTLARAYARPGTWITAHLTDAGPKTRKRFEALGIDLDAPDAGGSATGGGRGGLKARTRYTRAFVRALYYQHKWYSRQGASQSWERRTAPREAGALRVEVGRRVPASPNYDPAHPGKGFPANRIVRVQVARGGQLADRAVARLADRDRIYTPDGGEGDRWSDAGRRDWA